MYLNAVEIEAVKFYQHNTQGEKMLKKENRLRKNKHFKYIYKHGDSKVLNKLNLVYIKTKFKTYKVGFSVSKKIGKSVVRNNTKRRLRECFLSLSNNINKKYNYIFIAREGIENMSFLEIKQNMIDILKKCGLYNENI